MTLPEFTRRLWQGAPKVCPHEPAVLTQTTALPLARFARRHEVRPLNWGCSGMTSRLPAPTPADAQQAGCKEKEMLDKLNQPGLSSVLMVLIQKPRGSNATFSPRGIGARSRPAQQTGNPDCSCWCTQVCVPHRLFAPGFSFQAGKLTTWKTWQHASTSCASSILCFASFLKEELPLC